MNENKPKNYRKNRTVYLGKEEYTYHIYLGYEVTMSWVINRGYVITAATPCGYCDGNNDGDFPYRVCNNDVRKIKQLIQQSTVDENSLSDEVLEE